MNIGAAPEQIEGREYVRKSLLASAKIQPKDQPGSQCVNMGIVRNISRKGVGIVLYEYDGAMISSGTEFALQFTIPQSDRTITIPACRCVWFASNTFTASLGAEFTSLSPEEAGAIDRLFH